MSRKSDERWMDRHFPTLRAREAADAAVDAIPASAPMTTFTVSGSHWSAVGANIGAARRLVFAFDAWVAAYLAAGGRTDVKFD